jgi:hypothetical protein
MFELMNELKIRLSPEGGMTAAWNWEITLRGKKVAGGTSSGSQEFAYATAHEALLKFHRESELIDNPPASPGRVSN